MSFGGQDISTLIFGEIDEYGRMSGEKRQKVLKWKESF